MPRVMVALESGGQGYAYDCRDDTIAVGDRVIVPGPFWDAPGATQYGRVTALGSSYNGPCKTARRAGN